MRGSRLRNRGRSGSRRESCRRRGSRGSPTRGIGRRDQSGSRTGSSCCRCEKRRRVAGRTRCWRVVIVKISWSLQSNAAGSIRGRAGALEHAVCNPEVAGEDFFVDCRAKTKPSFRCGPHARMKSGMTGDNIHKVTGLRSKTSEGFQHKGDEDGSLSRCHSSIAAPLVLRSSSRGA